MSEFNDVEEAQAFLKHLKEHEVAIFNYFRAVCPRGDGSYKGPTTNALKQRNSNIRQAWRSGRGIHSIELLRLRVLYESWHIGTEIVPCTHSACEAFVGPLAGVGRIAGPFHPLEASMLPACSVGGVNYFPPVSRARVCLISFVVCGSTRAREGSLPRPCRTSAFVLTVAV